MKAHLFNCLNEGEVNNFIQNGFIGLGPFYPAQNATDGQIRARLRILWDVIADLKRVEIGDLCFLHSQGRIYGPFIFGSIFYESNNLPELLTSPNLRFQNWIANRNNFIDLEIDGYGYVAAIHQPVGCNANGANLMELFLRQAYGIFNGVPPRFMYGDTKKILKPILKHEIKQLFEILNYNGDLTVQYPSNFVTNNLSQVVLDLTSYGGRLFCEKILEAWFMQQMSLQDNNITELFGNYNYFANSIYTYYTNFLDVVAITSTPNLDLHYCEHCNNLIRDSANTVKIIELKRDHLSNGLDTINQIKSYMEWARYVLNPNAEISGYIVANSFHRDYIDYVTENEADNISLINYSIVDNSIQLSNAINQN